MSETIHATASPVFQATPIRSIIPQAVGSPPKFPREAAIFAVRTVNFDAPGMTDGLE